ncbi:hypothetical protein CDAR_92301 [Caerostris darwini]|uniref:Uncharacterized protein n=1 Tax=Caerostris darwini TaxID=1538125 RepID=A0AAV4PF63_9ARAC|nr:hypothetical protein CDAR_92301 [Caerostris darwini]
MTNANRHPRHQRSARAAIQNSPQRGRALVIHPSSATAGEWPIPGSVNRLQNGHETRHLTGMNHRPAKSTYSRLPLFTFFPERKCTPETSFLASACWQTCQKE